MSNLVLFYSNNKENGYLSNFAAYPIIIDNRRFLCNEQYIMFSKALLFGDIETAQLIMESSNPVQMKKLGRQVKNFDEKMWLNGNITRIADNCNVAKFTQYTKLKKLLLATGNATIAEASPYDKIWGIGVDTEVGKDRTKWQGTNILGESLMRVRDILKELESINVK
jgi:ribA/ribD-fused uncharacterized protein